MKTYIIGTNSGGTTNGALENTQLLVKSEIQKTEELLKNANIIDEASATVTYLGFIKENETLTTVANCVICKIEVVGSLTKIMYANGDRTTKDKIWNDRATLTYKY